MTNIEKFKEYVRYATVIVWLIASFATAAFVWSETDEMFYVVTSSLSIIGIVTCVVLIIRKLLGYKD